MPGLGRSKENAGRGRDRFGPDRGRTTGAGNAAGRLAMAAAVAGAVLVLSGSDALAQGCAMCRTAVEGATDPLSRGISLSVLFMVSMPFAIFTTIAGWLYISHRRQGGAAEGVAPSASGAGAAVAAGSVGETGHGAHSAAGAGPGSSSAESGGSQS